MEDDWVMQQDRTKAGFLEFYKGKLDIFNGARVINRSSWFRNLTSYQILLLLDSMPTSEVGGG